MKEISLGDQGLNPCLFKYIEDSPVEYLVVRFSPIQSHKFVPVSNKITVCQ